MTAQPRAGEPIVVQVALAARGYDIVIGRGVIASLGARIKALRPSARAALVTDDTVAAHHLAGAQAALKSTGIDCTAIRVAPGEGSKSYATFDKVCEAIIAARIERGDLVIALRRRRHRRSRRLCRGLRAARHRLRAGADDPAGAGRLLRRRQDRHQFPARQEPDRRLPPAEAGALPTPRCSTRCRSASSAPATPRWSNTACSATPPSSPGWRQTGATCFPARPRASTPSRSAAAAKAGIVAPRRTRDRRARAAQSRPHLRPCAGGRRRAFPARLLHGEAVALGMALALRILGARKACSARRRRARARSSCRGRPADADRRTCRAACRASTRLMELHRRRTRRSSAASSPSFWCAASARPSSRTMSIAAEVRAFLIDRLNIAK